MLSVDDITLATFKNTTATPSPTNGYLTAAPASQSGTTAVPTSKFSFATPILQSATSLTNYSTPSPFHTPQLSHVSNTQFIHHDTAPKTLPSMQTVASSHANTTAVMHAKAANNYKFPMPSSTVPPPPRPQAMVPPPTSLRHIKATVAAVHHSTSMPEIASYHHYKANANVNDEEEKMKKRLARNRVSARLRRLKKKNLVGHFSFISIMYLEFVSLLLLTILNISFFLSTCPLFHS